MEAITKNRDRTRVVYADVGLAEGRINWQAPVIQKYQIHGLPHYVVLDEGGRISAQGADASRMVSEWGSGP